MEPTLLTIDEAAAVLGLSPHTLRAQAKNGALRAVKRGRDWLVTPSAIAEYRQHHMGRPGRKPKPVNKTP